MKKKKLQQNHAFLTAIISKILYGLQLYLHRPHEHVYPVIVTAVLRLVKQHGSEAMSLLHHEVFFFIMEQHPSMLCVCYIL